MSNVQQLHATSARSPERDQLAAAIGRRNEAADRLARINTASEGTFVWDAQQKVERAEQNLENARKREPRRLIAGLVGDAASSGPSEEQAQWYLEEAREDLERARRTREALDEQRTEAERALEKPDRSLRDAARKVVLAGGGAAKVLAQYVEAQREVARLREILSLLNARDCLPRYWDSIPQFVSGQADKEWREAFAGLEADADAPLPK